MWGVNKNAVQVWGNEAQYYNVLRSNEISSKVRPYIRSLSADSISKICAYYYDAKVFISVPTSSGDPDRTLVYDRERLAWYKDW